MDFGIDYILELMQGKKDLTLMNAHVITKKRLWWMCTITTFKDPRGVICSGQMA